MYLSNLDLKWAIKCGHLIVRPEPDEASYDTDGIDLHLDKIDQAKIWDLDKFGQAAKSIGAPARLLKIGRFNFKEYGSSYFKSPPESADAEPESHKDQKVIRCGGEIVVRPGGFLLWQTREVVGTPEIHPHYIVFIDGKSVRARTGLLVHVTAPTIHAGWSGNITLELANVGPFDLALKPDDAIAQIRVAKLSNPPESRVKVRTISSGQQDVSGAAGGTG